MSASGTRATGRAPDPSAGSATMLLVYPSHVPPVPLLAPDAQGPAIPSGRTGGGRTPRARCAVRSAPAAAAVRGL